MSSETKDEIKEESKDEVKVEAKDEVKDQTESTGESDQKAEAATETITAADVKEDIKTEELAASEPKQLDEATVKAVADRLYFFFSDANVRHDVFVRKELLRDSGDYPNMVTIDKLLKFNTIKQHSTDPAVVVAAAKSLTEKLTLSADEKAIGRVTAFTNEKMDDNIPLSLYVSNLPYTGAVYNCKTDQIRDLFTTYGSVELVKMRFTNDAYDTHKKKGKRLPIGAALVEFETIEELQKAADDTLTVKDGKPCEPTRKLTVDDSGNNNNDQQPLQVMLLSEYVAERKKRKAEQQGGDDEKDDTPESNDKNDNNFTIDWKPGCVIRVKGLPADDCSREALLDAIAKALDTTVDALKDRKLYVDYSRGQKDGAIRFHEPGESVQKLCDSLKDGLEIVEGKGKVEEAYILEGDEEKEYWEKFIQFKRQTMSSRKNGNNNNNHHGNQRRSNSRKKQRH